MTPGQELAYHPDNNDPENFISGRYAPDQHVHWSSFLLSFGLYRRPRIHTGSCAIALVGCLYRLPPIGIWDLRSLTLPRRSLFNFINASIVTATDYVKIIPVPGLPKYLRCFLYPPRTGSTLLKFPSSVCHQRAHWHASCWLDGKSNYPLCRD